MPGVSRNPTARIVVLVVTISFILTIVLIGWFVCFRGFIIGSGSMQNTLCAGDRVLVDRLSSWLNRPLRRGDIIAFRFPLDRKQAYIHRIVGIPGDRLKVRDKLLYRNGAAVAEPYARHSTTYFDPYRDNFPDRLNVPTLPQPVLDMFDNDVLNGELVIPAGRYFVMGDNRDNAADSRYFGFVQRSDVIGWPMLIYASPDPARAWKAVH